MNVLQDHRQPASIAQCLHQIRPAVWRGVALALLLWLTVPMVVMAAQPTQRLDLPHHPERILVRLVSGTTAQSRSDLHVSMGAARLL